MFEKKINVQFLISPLLFPPCPRISVFLLTSNATRSGQVKRISSSWLTSWQWRWLVLKDRRIAWFDGILDPKAMPRCPRWEIAGPFWGMIKGQ